MVTHNYGMVTCDGGEIYQSGIKKVNLLLPA